MESSDDVIVIDDDSKQAMLSQVLRNCIYGVGQYVVIVALISDHCRSTDFWGARVSRPAAHSRVGCDW